VRVAFVKTGGPRDRVHVERADGSEASWAFPSYGPSTLPHDLVHFVVEVQMGLRDGVFGSVARGADLMRINERANRVGGEDAYAALGEDVWLSEVLANVPWRGTDAQIREAIAHNAEQMGVSTAGLRPEDLRRLRDALVDMRERWRSLDRGAGLHLTWPEAPT